METFFETDMYEPIKDFFERIGYTVKGEVKNCDLVAIKDDELIIIEMKKSFNMTLLFQALERQSINWNTFVAIPRPRNARDRDFRHIKHISAKLGLGLLTVAMDSPIHIVEAVCFPIDSQKKHSSKSKNIQGKIIKEASLRNFDSKGGSTRTKLNTAFREKCVKIACVLKSYGSMSAKDLVKLYSCDKNAWHILHSNYYGWFYKADKGVYGITGKGIDDLNDSSLSQLVKYYSERL